VNCDEFLGAWDLLVDAETGKWRIDPQLLARLREHRAACAACRAESARTSEFSATLARKLGRGEADAGEEPEAAAD